MSKLFLRAALVGVAAAGAAVAQTPTAPPPIVVAPPVPTLNVRPTPTAPAEMVLKTFDLGDLVCPPADSPLAKPGTDKAMIAAARAYTDARATEVFKAICAETGCHPKTMELTSDGKTLVVRNTAEVVDKIGPCVAAVRQARTAQVRVEVVLVSVPSGHAAVGRLFGDKPHASMNPAEVKEWMVRLQESPAVNVLCQPKMVVMNKQTGFCQVGEPAVSPCGGGTVAVSPVGTTTRVTPEVSADGKLLMLAVEVEHSEKCGSGVDCQKAKMSVVVPDGGSMAVKVGSRTVERKIESKVPVVSEIPYVGRLFHSVGVSSEPTDVVAVVTATRVTVPAGVCAPQAAVCPHPVPLPAVPVMRSLVAPIGVALPQPVRAVAADSLERVGVSFNTLTSPTVMMPVPGWVMEGQRVLVLPRGDAVRVTAVPGRDVVRFTSGQWAAAATSAVGAAEVSRTDETAALMASYHAACAAGRKDEAAKLAVQLLAKDPTCFGKK
jgi:hypothetical protein